MIEAEVRKMLNGEEMNLQTKANYENYCFGFFDWWFRSNPKADPMNVEPVDVMEWLDTHETWKPATRYAAAAALKKFYKWKYGEDHLVTKVKVKRKDPGPQRTLDEDELLTVLASIDTSTIGGIRDMAILSVMVDTGIRSSEVCNLELSRLNMEKRRFTVLVKGGWYAEKLFFEHTAIYLDNWLAMRPKIASENVNNVFVSVGGKRPGSPMTKSGIRYLSQKMSRISSVEKFSPHSLRRTFATLAISNGAPTRVVQIAGGWKSVRMVERYTQALNPDTIRQYSPIDKMMGIQ